MTTWRLLRDGITDAHHHFAVEEALVRLVDEGLSPPTLRLRQVRRAVFVGVFQDTWSEVDVDYCRQHDIEIVRRPNAGGAVYHDLGSFCYSAFFPRTTFSQSEEELYRLFAGPIIRTCADYGVTAHFHGANDVLIGERKVYGSAQLAWYGTLVQSGTFLINMDFDTLGRALTPPALKFADKAARSVKERVTSLAREVGRELDVDEVMAHFATHFVAGGTQPGAQVRVPQGQHRPNVLRGRQVRRRGKSADNGRGGTGGQECDWGERRIA